MFCKKFIFTVTFLFFTFFAFFLSPWLTPAQGADTMIDANPVLDVVVVPPADEEPPGSSVEEAQAPAAATAAAQEEHEETVFIRISPQTEPTQPAQPPTPIAPQPAASPAPQPPQTKPPKPAAPTPPTPRSSARFEKTNAPKVDKRRTESYAVYDPAPGGGVMVRVNAGYNTYWFWNVDDARARQSDGWELTADIERLDTGGSGVMFGDKDQTFLAVYVKNDKAVVSRSVAGKPSVLSEYVLKPQNRRTGKLVMRLKFQRKTGDISCTLNGTAYNFPSQGKWTIPEIKHYGLYGTAVDDSNATINIFRRISVKAGN